jgi:hypothetical protein
MQPAPLLKRFFGPGIDSANRLQIMLQELEHHPRSMFWSSFQAVWPTCEDTWFARDLALEALRWNGPAADFLNVRRPQILCIIAGHDRSLSRLQPIKAARPASRVRRAARVSLGVVRPGVRYGKPQSAIG